MTFHPVRRSKIIKNRRTDGPTDGPTDTTSCRDAQSHLNSLTEVRHQMRSGDLLRLTCIRIVFLMAKIHVPDDILIKFNPEILSFKNSICVCYRRTDERTDGHDLFQRCVVASKNARMPFKTTRKEYDGDWVPMRVTCTRACARVCERVRNKAGIYNRCATAAARSSSPLSDVSGLFRNLFNILCRNR